jgi:energy-converting hydrogenase Eha subunit C
MKKVLSKLFTSALLIGGFALSIANSVYADIAAPVEPSEDNRAVVAIILVIVVILVAIFAFTTKRFNKKFEANVGDAGAPAIQEEGKESKEENKEEK